MEIYTMQNASKAAVTILQLEKAERKAGSIARDKAGIFFHNYKMVY